MKGNLSTRQRLIHKFEILWNRARQSSSSSSSSSSRPVLPKVFLIILAAQSFWWIYDKNITSQVYHKPRKVYVKPTEASPLVPFYDNNNNNDNNNNHNDESYLSVARAFPVWPYSNFPCGPFISDSNFLEKTTVREGILFAKLSRAAPTTVEEDVTARIARNAAKRMHKTAAKAMGLNATSALSSNACTARLGPLKARRWRDRIREKSFLWTTVREPAFRLLSTFYQLSVSVGGLEPTVKNLHQYVSDNDLYDYGYYFKALTLRKSLNAFRTDLYEEYLKEILYGFDFIGIAERQEESLAVLQLILGLETTDMLQLSQQKSKQQQQQQQQSSSSRATSKVIYQKKHDRKQKKDECIEMHEPIATLEMKEWFHTGEAEDVLEPDVMFYKAANKSLDLTIEQLGHDKVQQAIKVLKWAQEKADTHCGRRVKYPCSDDGQPLMEGKNDCLNGDVACGFACLDDLKLELSTTAV